MLVLGVRDDEDFLVHDDATGLQMKVRIHHDKFGKLICGFDGPKRIGVTRIERIKSARELPQINEGIQYG